MVPRPRSAGSSERALARLGPISGTRGSIALLRSVAAAHRRLSISRFGDRRSCSCGRGCAGSRGLAVDEPELRQPRRA